MTYSLDANAKPAAMTNASSTSSAQLSAASASTSFPDPLPTFPAYVPKYSLGDSRRKRPGAVTAYTRGRESLPDANRIPSKRASGAAPIEKPQYVGCRRVRLVRSRSTRAWGDLLAGDRVRDHQRD